jgi:hypothetical protein
MLLPVFGRLFFLCLAGKLKRNEVLKNSKNRLLTRVAQKTQPYVDGMLKRSRTVSESAG